MEIADDALEMVVRRVETRNGVRLEIREAGADGVRLDAVALESLSWQSRETIDGLASEAGYPPESAPGEPGGTPADGGEPGASFAVANEYAKVFVRRVETRNGARLEIDSARLPHSTRLGPRGLKGVSTQPPERFSEFLSEPFGPGGH